MEDPIGIKEMLAVLGTQTTTKATTQQKNTNRKKWTREDNK